MTDWLKEFCDPGGRLICQQPWQVMIAGQPWGFALDGKLGVLLAEEGWPPLPATEAPLADKSLGGKRTRIGGTIAAAVLAWSGPWEAATEAECPNCHGGGECECQCGAEHECGLCDGTGKVMQSGAVRSGMVGEQALNRNLIAKAFRHLSGACEVFTADKLLEFRGEGWRVLIATLDRTGADAPKLELTT